MSKRIIKTLIPTGLAMAVALLIAGLSGCSSESTAASSEKQPILASASASSSEKSGNQLWAEQCARCHNMRDPATYSDVNWSIAMHHMRVRADLNAQDSRKILEFLKSAN
jgi:cytochrome c553